MKIETNEFKGKRKMNSELIIYQTEDGQTKIRTRLEDETVWLTIEQMQELFQKAKSTINKQILNMYKEGELEKDASSRKIGNSDFSTTAKRLKK
ncbi:hypothetical protein [Pedobacter borealis]|uniref:hypothetical protein n=1 Tax=Pedobacter borealis TaxID=475254 RepID=UPI00055E6B92|nr:hypothetical protein [Pedobacter borealis]